MSGGATTPYRRLNYKAPAAFISRNADGVVYVQNHDDMKGCGPLLPEMLRRWGHESAEALFLAEKAVWA